MKFKKSFYTIIEMHGTRTFLINTLSRAVAELEKDDLSEVLQFIDNPNNTSYRYFDELYKNGFIIDSEVDEQNLLEYNYNKQFFCKDTLFISVLPTTQCNFSCPYCFENDAPLIMSNDSIEILTSAICRKIPALSKLHISFFGGEPLICWNAYKDSFIKVKFLAEESGCLFSSSITTNGYLLNTIDLDDFISLNLNEIHVTFDCNKKNHDRLRKTIGGLETFDRILDNLRLVREHFVECGYNIKVVIRVNLLNNSNDDIQNFMSNFDDSDKNYFYFYFKPIFNTSCFAVDNFNNDNFKEFSKHVMEDGFKIVSPFDHYGYAFCASDGGTNQIMVLPDLSIWKCYNDSNCENAKIGTIDRSGFLFDERKLVNWYAKNPFRDTKCRDCVKLPICFGGCPLLFSQNRTRHCIDDETNNLANDFLLDC